MTSELVQEEVDSSAASAGFRSSRSYIKSLIDVLAKAKAQIPSSEMRANQLAASRLLNDDDDDDDDDDEHHDAADKQQQCAVKPSPAVKSSELTAVDAGQQQHQQDTNGAGVIRSQMDISAAHLILAYMEQHLEDKERLGREWLELNAGQKPLTVPPGSKTSATGAKQLMLQKLAKVALNDDNRDKNRNLSVVPYDRYRVKLLSCPAPTTTSALANSSLKGVRSRANNNKQANNNSKQTDYINASFIYDSDPRTPTHIIAQGPSEQTVSHFWQVSVISAIQRTLFTQLSLLFSTNTVLLCKHLWQI